MSTMWSTCSMSTGHCSTQAPHVVQLHSTSGSTTPPTDTSGTLVGSGPAVVSLASRAAAVRYGAWAYAWSRSPITNSLGDNGFSVFQAGHWLWQRPHSVHVVKSSRPFQVKSVI